MNPDRTKMLRAAFHTKPPEILGLTTRPFSVGVLDLCYALELKLFTGTPEERTAMTDREQNRELIAILFLLSQPEDVISDLVANVEDAWSRWLIPFGLSVDVTSLDKVAAYVVEISQQVVAAAIETVKKPEIPGAEPEPTPPPN